jgi:hypothetical protein
MNARVPVIRIETEFVNNAGRFKRVQSGVHIFIVGSVETALSQHEEDDHVP